MLPNNTRVHAQKINGALYERVRDIVGTRSTHKTFVECVSLLGLAGGEWHRDTHFIVCE